MKFIFKRDEENKIVVKLIDGTTEKDFDYIYLIEYLYNNKLSGLEKPEFSGDISEEEQKKLCEMIGAINTAVATVAAIPA